MTQPPRLLDRVRQAIRLKHFSLKTEKSYLYYIKDFILFHNKRYPREMGVEEIRAYLSHLAIERNVAALTQNVALSALLFLYRQVLELDLPYICKRSLGLLFVLDRLQVQENQTTVAHHRHGDRFSVRVIAEIGKLMKPRQDLLHLTLRRDAK